MEVSVNGKLVQIPERWRDDSLLFVLREALGLVGAKYGCGAGVCGACTVLVDGEAVRCCVIKPFDVKNKSITTIEGLTKENGELSTLQKVWADESVSQCGYCQAGQIMNAAALLRKTPKPTDAQIEEAFSNSLCRCGTYQRIKVAVRKASEAGR
jgi:isoquinoline 1-oxidoreductase subunit alpha